MRIVILDGFTADPGDLSWEELEALGYRPGQRLITIAQQRAIVEAIGEP